MSGGTVVILGKTGRNFAGGMSGGIAYVYDENGTFWKEKCNQEMVLPEALSPNDEEKLYHLIQNHVNYTECGRFILENWEEGKHAFVKVMPIEYKKALEQMAINQESLNA